MLGRPSYRIFTAIVPVLAVLGLLGVVVWQAISIDEGPETTTVGYVDEVGSFTNFREDTRTRTTFQPFANAESGTAALLEGEVDSLYVIPEDYVATGLVFEIKERSVGIPTGDRSNAALERFLLNNLLVGVIGPENAARVIEPVNVATIEVDEHGAVVEEPTDFPRLIFFMGAAILVIMSVLTTSGYLLQGLNEEKENRIMEVLLSSISPNQLMLGKLAGLGTAGLFQMLIWAMSGMALFLGLPQVVEAVPSVPLPSPGLLAIALLYFLLGYAFYGTVMASLGAVTTSQREAGQITFIFVLPAIIPLWFIQLLLEHPDGPVSRALSFIPFTAPTASLVRLASGGMGAMEVVLSLLVMSLGVFLAVKLTQRLFRTYLLMYGQRPGLRQVLRTLTRG